MNDITRTAGRNQSEVARRQDDSATQPLTRTPPVDIEENSHGITLWMDLPGVSRDQVNIEVHDHNLRIEGQAVVPTPGNLQVHYVERPESRFSRSFTLGVDLDVSQIDANLEDGVLRLRIPRLEEARPRRIEIQAG
ncbi:Hsp20/alpha crystallin family protein [Pollutimonas thiosulfatoxidans]|uniref:Heat-shock protein n=1 Tax=Pollutimonas thiosulfatoxidans TaxID=2028345 RepID=A0A410GBJ7_9BURK|nr:Hsp20/alpha crystallin family protein [Pollutimonas thiosulfatoxidans]QAA93667.1 heat-shock protein [Pollutimonas thiosulfatoxidans]